MTAIKKPSFAQNDYEIIERNIMYEGIFRMVQYHLRHKLFKGGWSQVFLREIMERRSAVGVLPYDPIRDEVVLIEQFRVGAISSPSPWLLEIVAGILDKDETPEEVAIREAIEEAGCKITQLHPLYRYFVSPGGSTEQLSLFIGRVDASQVTGVYGLVEETENIRAFTVPCHEAFQMVADGNITTSPALITLMWLQLNKERLLKIWQVK